MCWRRAMKNIKADLAAINRGRLEPIRLRYFQYLAALYTELYLYWRATDRLRFKKRLNAFVAEANRRMVYGTHYPFFNDTDLDKIAYWMATGSGKTLLLHLNYRQFFRYQVAPLDDVLLITPNEGLSAQHLDELEKSGLPGLPFSQAEAMTLTGEKSIRVIEITKFTEKKTGRRVSVDIDHFEGNSNLIFVDEGHKGSGGEVWKGYRDRLGANGFTFDTARPLVRPSTLPRTRTCSRNIPSRSCLTILISISGATATVRTTPFSTCAPIRPTI